MGLIDLWKRRKWHKDEEAFAALKGSKPALLITGGSDGIGLALAETFASPERTTILISRDKSRLNQAKRTLTKTTAADILTLPLDITSESALPDIHALLDAHDLYVDILINSAGIGTTGNFVTDPADDLTSLTGLNVTALTRLCRAFLPNMLTRGRGGVLNVSSIAGFAPGPYQAAYYASKAYVTSLTRAMAYEGRGKGVRIAALTPGPVNTRFHERANGTSALYRLVLPAMSPEQIAASTRRGYQLGHTLITPGIFSNIVALAMRLTPAVIVVPIIAILLRPRK